MVLEMAH